MLWTMARAITDTARVNRYRVYFVLISSLAPTLSFASVLADDNGDDAETAQLPPVLVESTAIDGAAIEADKVPGNLQTISAHDIARDGAPSLTRALDSQLGSVSIGDDLDDPFQPDIL